MINITDSSFVSSVNNKPDKKTDSPVSPTNVIPGTTTSITKCTTEQYKTFIPQPNRTPPGFHNRSYISSTDVTSCKSIGKLIIFNVSKLYQFM